MSDELAKTGVPLSPMTVAPRTVPTQPWKPAQVLKVAEKLGFRRKWVREDLTDKFLAEGWKFVDNKNKSINPPKTIVDGAPLSTVVQKRELVLMEITEALAQSRDAYFKSLTDGSLESSVDEFKKTANEGSGKSYGEVKIIGGGNK